MVGAAAMLTAEAAAWVRRHLRRGAPARASCSSSAYQRSPGRAAQHPSCHTARPSICQMDLYHPAGVLVFAPVGCRIALDLRRRPPLNESTTLPTEFPVRDLLQRPPYPGVPAPPARPFASHTLHYPFGDVYARARAHRPTATCTPTPTWTGFRRRSPAPSAALTSLRSLSPAQTTTATTTTTLSPWARTNLCRIEWWALQVL